MKDKSVVSTINLRANYTQSPARRLSLNRPSQNRCITSALLSIYFSTVGFYYFQTNVLNTRQDAINMTEQEITFPQKEALTNEPSEITNSSQISFVADIIKSEHPAHPDSKALADLIVSESKKASLDPLFVTAVVRAESMFKSKAVSKRGAKGLMQIMPKTGKYLAKIGKIELKDTDLLHHPETNIKLGIQYLKHLEIKFQGSREKILVAYNWGPSNLAKALSTGSKYPRESQEYVQRVLEHHTKWSTHFTQLASARLSTTSSKA